MSILLSVDEMLLPSYVNWSINFRGLPLRVEVGFVVIVFAVVVALHSSRSQCVPFHTKWTVGPLYGINRSLQHYGVQIEFCAGTVSVDFWTTTTTTTQKHLHHHMSNGFMRVLLRLKSLLGPCCNITARKSDEHTKNMSWFVNIKVYSLLHFLSGRREERNSVWKLSRPR